MACFVPSPTFSTVPDVTSNPFITGLEISITGNTTLTVQPGAARALCSDLVISYPQAVPGLPSVITVSTATVGANGVYPATIASLGLSSDTTFPVYIISNSAGTTGGSLSSALAPAVVIATGNNFLPAGYDAFRRIGYVYVDSATGNLIHMKQSGKSNDRLYMLESGVSVLTNGHATTATSLDLTTGDGVVPSKDAQTVILGVTLAGNAANAYLRMYPTGNATLGNGSAGVITPVATQTLGVSSEMICGINTSGRASIDYLLNNSSSTANIFVLGFVDSLGANLF